MATSDGITLRMTRVLPAPREEVYRAMTDPDRFASWWGPAGFTSPSVDFEPRVGHRYRIEMKPPQGDPFRLAGEFREVDPPARLAFTFEWEPPDPDDRETLAALSLEESGNETRVQLTQGGFATEERRALHEGGWGDSFDRLAKLLD